MPHLLLQLFRSPIVAEDHAETVLGPVCLARCPDHVENGVVVFAACGDHHSHYRNIVALEVQLRPSGTAEDEDAIEVEKSGRQVLEELDDYPKPCET
jgi:hypothetical protein